MSGQGGPARRVVLGVSETRELRLVVETAAALASGLKAGLHCVMVEHEDLFAVAGLPFARAFRAGGSSQQVTLELVENHFRALARAVERELAASCARAQVEWALARPQGDYLRELLAAAEAGDVVVLDRDFLRRWPGGALAAMGQLLAKASAVMVPSPRPLRDGVVLALAADGEAAAVAALARDIAAGIGAEARTMTLDRFLAGPGRAAVVVAQLPLAEMAGEAAFFRRIDEAGAAAVLVRG